MTRNGQHSAQMLLEEPTNFMQIISNIRRLSSQGMLQPANQTAQTGRITMMQHPAIAAALSVQPTIRLDMGPQQQPDVHATAEELFLPAYAQQAQLFRVNPAMQSQLQSMAGRIGQHNPNGPAQHASSAYFSSAYQPYTAVNLEFAGLHYLGHLMGVHASSHSS